MYITGQQGVVLEWLRERFAKPCFVGSIPTHASIFFVPKPQGPNPKWNIEDQSGSIGGMFPAMQNMIDSRAPGASSSELKESPE